MRYYLGSLWFTLGRKLFGNEHGVQVRQFDRDGRHHVVVDIGTEHIDTTDEHSEIAWPERDCAG